MPWLALLAGLIALGLTAITIHLGGSAKVGSEVNLAVLAGAGALVALAAAVWFGVRWWVG